jgi:hypothetical protein
MPKNKNVLMNIYGVDFHIDDNSYKHFKSLPKKQQEAIKQTMILGMLNDRYY